VSDPGGTEWLVPLDAWNPDERGGIAWPVVVLFDPDGREVFRFRSRDVADRSDDDDLMGALTKLGLPPVALGPSLGLADAVEDPEAFHVDAFAPYFRGFRTASRVLGARATDASDRVEVEAFGMVALAGRFLDEWEQRRSATIE
jgi:hypothetical protein